jgi:hypothetical protein
MVGGQEKTASFAVSSSTYSRAMHGLRPSLLPELKSLLDIWRQLGGDCNDISKRVTSNMDFRAR